jgi:phospholipid-binding lipoprotein MlaA
MLRRLTASLKLNDKREYGLKCASLTVMLICNLFFSVFFLQPAGAVDLLSVDTLEGIVSSTQTRDMEAFDQFEEFEETSADSGFDPLEKYNRFMTQVNDKLYVWVLKPVAQGYRTIVNEPVRMAVSRFFKNLYFPVRLVNNLLQLKFERAGIETARFGLNSTLGFFGFFDTAKLNFNLDAYPEDFGQTLGYAGFGSGFHVVLPLLGPSNVRDVFGKIPDIFLNPMYYVDNTPAAIGISVGERINTVSLSIEEFDSFRKDAVDLYPFMRNAYEKSRNKEIKD